MTHHPCNPPLADWMRTLQTSTVTPNPKMLKILPEPPILGRRNCRSLKSLVMPSILPNPPDDIPGTSKCKRRQCVICSEHLVVTDTFQSCKTKEVFTLRHTFTCDSSNIVYLLFCTKCRGTQYVGQTENSLRQRFYLHRSDIRANRGTLVTKHFNSPDHTLHDVRCLPIEKVHSNLLSKRLEREWFWMKKLDTITPSGLNVREKPKY